MDLLDLQLDLNVEGNSSSGPVTRRSQAIKAATATQATTPKTSTTTPKTASAAKTPAKNATPKPPGTSKTATTKPSEASSSTPKTPVVNAPKVVPTTSTASKVSTPKQAPTSKSSTIVASAPKTASTPKASVVAKTNTPKPTTATATPAPSQSQTPKVSATTPKVAQLRDDFSESPSDSRGSSIDRTSRADSMERRSRNKAKKRFSPSPIVPNKKRRSVPTPRQGSASGAAPVLDNIFAEHLVVLEDLFKTQGPTDFELPAHWNDPTSPDISEHVTGLDTFIADNTLNTETPSQTASSSTPSVKRINKKEQKPRNSVSSVAISRKSGGSEVPKKEMDAASNSTARAVGGADGEGTSNARCRTHSSELGVDDITDDDKAPSTSDVVKPRSVSAMPAKKSKKSTDTSSLRNSSVGPSQIKASRRSRRLSAAAHDDEQQEAEEKDVNVKTKQNMPDEEEEAPKSQKRVSKKIDKQSVVELEKTTAKKPNKKNTVSEKTDEPLETDESEEPTSSTAPKTSQKTPKAVNPNSALAIRQKLMESEDPTKKHRKSLVAARKATVVEQEGVKEKSVPKKEHLDNAAESAPGPSSSTSKTDPEPVETHESTGPSSSAEPAATVPESPTAATTPKVLFKTPASTVRAIRSSGRVSKPNRLYVDQDYNTEVLGRDTVMQQNIVIEALAKEATPEPEPTSSSTISTPRPSQPKKKSVPKEYVPKPIPILNGVHRGYVPSVKVPLEDIEVDGVVEKLNEVVTSVLDVVLLKVCQDGVVQHENIDPKVVRAKAKVKADNTKRAKLEAKKLDIQMTMKTPSTVESVVELGKRKRHAPRSDDYYWTQPAHKTKKEVELREDRDSTPAEEDEEPGEKVQQKARESISHLFDAEMDATMKEAKSFTVPFHDYIKPKLVTAQQKAGIKLMSRKRGSAVPEDFFYHELLTDHPSPTNSNIENEDVDVDGIDEPEEPVTEEIVISIRTDALDYAEQIAVLIPRPTQMDGSPIGAEDLEGKIIEQPESRKKSFHTTMQIVLDQLAYESSPAPRDPEEQGCAWHTVTSANAQLLKNLYNLASAQREDVVPWTHHFLVQNLPIHILASYLSLLRYSRRMDPVRFGAIVNSTEGHEGEWPQATNLLKTFVYGRGTEPGTEVLNNTIPHRRLTNTVFLLVSPTMTFGAPNCQARLHGRLFRWLHSIGHFDSEMIGFNEDSDQSLSVAEHLSDVIIDQIIDKVRQKSTERPHCKIVLVGYGASTYLVHRAVNMVEGVAAVISIGFPVMTPFGRRGTVEDDILLTYCPTLFIVGAEGQRFDNRAMTELRSNMLNPTGLVVVAHANDSLLVPTSFLLRLGISQTVVFRMILEKILNFLYLEPMRTQEVSETHPIELNNVYDLDSSLLKSDKALSGLAFATSTPAASPVGSSGRRATVAGGEEMHKKRRPESSSSHQPPPFFPLHGAPAPSPRGEDNFPSYQDIINVVSTADDMPRRASMGSSPRVIERGDFRDRAAALPPMPSTSSARQLPHLPPPQAAAPAPSPSSRGPVDPASISLS